MALWRGWLLVRRTVGAFAESGGTRLAAAIAYYALLSLFPLVIVLVAAIGTVLSAEQARDQVIDPIVSALPLTEEGATDLRGALEGAGAGARAVGILGLVGLLWTASGMMGAIRAGLSAVTGAQQGRPFLHGKLVDLAMVLLAGGAILVSTALTLVGRLAQDRLPAPLGLSGAWGASVEVVASVLLAFVVLAALLRLVPAARIPWEGVWRGALGGALALWVLTSGFALYLQSFSRYNAVYGSLGAVVAFLVFVFLAAIVLLMAAAAAARWCEVGRASRPAVATRGPSPALRVRRALAGLVGRQ